MRKLTARQTTMFEFSCEVCISSNYFVAKDEEDETMWGNVGVSELSENCSFCRLIRRCFEEFVAEDASEYGYSLETDQKLDFRISFSHNSSQAEKCVQLYTLGQPFRYSSSDIC